MSDPPETRPEQHRGNNRRMPHSRMDDSSHKVSLRKFPYPYRCALALSNDIDETTLEHFVQTHNFLNSDAETVYGKGLGLETSSSFWMFDVDYQDDSFCYFEGLSERESKCAPIIRELVHSGHLDTLHTYGNFSRVGGFKRELAERAIEELDKHGMKVNVWVNHGDKFNEQNIGVVRRKGGDRPGSEAYHADILREYGVRFVDADVITDIVGQDRPCSFWEAYLAPNGRSYFREVARKLTKAAMMATDELSRRLAGRDMFHKFSYAGDNRLMFVLPLQDGMPMFHFRRFGFWEEALADDLPFLLSDWRLSRLIEKEGYMVLYIHLGRFRRGKTRRFSDNVLKVFRKLEEHSASGQVWVTTVSKLLRYNAVYHNIMFAEKAGSDRTRIEIIGINDPFSGERMPDASSLEGLTFFCDDPDTTTIYLGEKKLETRQNGPDPENGLKSVSIPLSRLPKFAI